MPAREAELAELRAESWRQFLAAAEAWAAGDPTQARNLVADHPIVRSELTAFARAIRAGTLIKDASDRYRALKAVNPPA